MQVTNAFQRAEFWKYAQPTGINPSFGVKLAFKTLNAGHHQRAERPGGELHAIGCGNGLLGAANINWLDTTSRTS